MAWIDNLGCIIFPNQMLAVKLSDLPDAANQMRSLTDKAGGCACLH